MKIEKFKTLAVDPGDKRIGIAISDETNTLARPLSVINHVSRTINAKLIISIANENKVKSILIGQSLDGEGIPTYSGRKAARLAAEISTHGNIPVMLWDESHSTVDAKKLSIDLGKKKKDRKGHQDDLAAAFILQSYLDSNEK